MFPLGCFPLPLTDAGSMVLGKSRRTFTREAADGVHTQELTVVLFGGTLVKIYKEMEDEHQGRTDSTALLRSSEF